MSSCINSENILFQLENVSYSYDGYAAALDEINMAVRAGEKVALLGSNGSGKSTLLKILDGLYFPTSGKVSAFGQELSEEIFRKDSFNFAFHSRVGLVFQDSDAQLFMPSVLDEVAFAPLQLDISKEDVRSRVEEALRALHIEALRARAPHQLSSGEKKKVALASLLTLAPEVWLFDEPSAGLDPRSVAWLTDFINTQGEEGKTVILATHDLDLVRSVADRVTLIGENHQIAAEGSVQQVLADRGLLLKENLI